MDYNALLDLVTELGYRLAMSGAETFRIEECAHRILAVYDISCEVFAIPNCLIVSIETPEGKPMTRMRRIGHHGNDLDSVERYNNLSRRICSEKPTPAEAMTWLKHTDTTLVHYGFRMVMLGSFLGPFGFSFLYGANFVDAICAGLCGLIVGLINRFTDQLQTNLFFRTIAAAFFSAVPAYALGALGVLQNVDSTIIGTLMLLVPGLLITNAMRDIIFGDTNSGVNRVVQVFLIAAAICLGTGAAFSLSFNLWGSTAAASPAEYSVAIQLICSAIGCLGFSILFNIHGPGMWLCVLGGVLSWLTYVLSLQFGTGDIIGYFLATVVSAIYAEIMARLRKYPAISYLVVSIFPLLPGAGVYYTMSYAVRGDMASFADQGIYTISIAGIMAVGMLLVSTSVRIWNIWKSRK